MAPPPRRRAPPLPPPQFTGPVPDSEEESDDEDFELDQSGFTVGALPESAPLEIDDEEVGEEEDEVDEPQALDSDSESSITSSFPIPPNYREISTLASWTVSSCKPGCGVPQLRDPLTTLFWQSDGPQPHYLNIHFFKLVRIVGLRLYLDFEADESYTPTRIIFLAGSGQNDLVEWGEMRLEQPRGWIWADFEGVGEGDESEEDSNSEDDDEDEEEENHPVHPSAEDPHYQHPLAAGSAPRPRAGSPEIGLDPMPIDTPLPNTLSHPLPSSQPTPSGPSLTRPHPRTPLHPLQPDIPVPTPKRRKQRTPVLRAHLVQIKILENHQNGKDTHLRGLQVFAKDTEMGGARKRRESVNGKGIVGIGGGGGGGRGRDGMVEVGGRRVRGLERSVWDVEPVIR